MAIPARRKFTHYRGDDFRFTFRIEQPEGSPLDMTGWTAQVVVSNADVAMTVSAPDVTGTLTVDLTAEEVADAGVGEVVVFDVQLTDTSGFRRTYLVGSLFLEAEVAP